MPEKPSDTREFTITRMLDAPRELVFRAWTTPEHLARWFGPRECATPLDTISLDVRPGGSWRARMVHEDGTEYPTGGVYREVVEPERLVFTWGVAEGSAEVPEESVVTVTFADLGAKTEMTFHQSGFGSDQERGNVQEGWAECLEKFAEYLAGAGRRQHVQE